MPASTPLPPDELERLMAEVDEGLYDEQLHQPSGGLPASAQPQRYSELKQFDIKAWAERRGIKLPDA